MVQGGVPPLDKGCLGEQRCLRELWTIILNLGLLLQPFSTKEQGYTVSDCTAEGLKAVMMLQSLP